MNILGTAASDIGGALLVIGTSYNVLSTLVVPRSGTNPVFAMVDAAVDRPMHVAVARLGYKVRDRILATEAPLIVLAHLLVWLGFFVVGFALILLPLEAGVAAALRESASSMFTLGFFLRSGHPPASIDFVAAAAGMITIALQIGYLPVLYGAYNRRETEVTLLGLRTVNPPWGPALLARSARFGTIDRLPALYENWERWASDVSESHANYPVLLRFRSPKSDTSWVVALISVLDSAAIWLACAPSSAPAHLRLTLRAGYLCLWDLAETAGLSVDRDPHPDGILNLTFEEFREAYEAIAESGFPLEKSADESWPDFKGWRMNYESTAYDLARRLDAVPALWSGPRRSGETPLPPEWIVNRTPQAPESKETLVVRPSSARPPD